MKHEYTVIYQTIEDGWVMATVPELPGAATQGKDLEEARAMIKEAVELLLGLHFINACHVAPCQRTPPPVVLGARAMGVQLVEST